MQINRESFARGRLTAKLGIKIPGSTYSTGLQVLGLDEKRDGLIYVPPGYNPDNPGSFGCNVTWGRW
jgi:hypothetical protein